MLPSPSPLLQTAPKPSLTLGAKYEGVGAEKAVKRKGVKVALSPGRSWPSRRLPPLVPARPPGAADPSPGRYGEAGCERPPEPASANAAPAVASPSRGRAWLPREEARRGLRLPAAGPRLQPAAPGPPSKPLPAGRGSLPCPRLGSRRSARSPWRQAISVARPGSALLPAPSRTALSAPPRSTWDVALAASGEPGRNARWEIVAAAARAAATPQTAPPAACHREGSEPGRQGWSGGRGEAYSCSRESRNMVHRLYTLLRVPGLDKIHLDAFPRSRKNGRLTVAPPGAQRPGRGSC